jgi:hypothetical protein
VTRSEASLLDAVWALAGHIEVEHFEDGAVLLDMRRKSVAELERAQAWVLERLDGKRSLAGIVEEYAAAWATSREDAYRGVAAACDRLLELGCLRLAQGSWKGVGMDETRYVQNPDVNLREEDEDGALLFNPDTDRVQLLNSTGLYIWKLCARGRTQSEIAAAFLQDFDEVPAAAVAADVEEFVTGMLDSGFLGVQDASPKRPEPPTAAGAETA